MKSQRKDKSTRKSNKVDKMLLWSVIEDLIDEMTTVQVYANYVHCNLKRDMVKARNHMVKEVAEQMALEVAMKALADLKVDNALSESKSQNDLKIEHIRELVGDQFDSPRPSSAMNDAEVKTYTSDRPAEG